MTHVFIKLTTIGLAGLAVSGCTIPNYFDTSEPAKLEATVAPQVAPPPAVAASTVTAPVEPAATTVKPRWAHQPSGNTEQMSDADEDGGWS